MFTVNGKLIIDYLCAITRTQEKKNGVKINGFYKDFVRFQKTEKRYFVKIIIKRQHKKFSKKLNHLDISKIFEYEKFK